MKCWTFCICLVLLFQLSYFQGKIFNVKIKITTKQRSPCITKKELQCFTYFILETEGPLEELSFTYVLLNIVKCKQHFVDQLIMIE